MYMRKEFGKVGRARCYHPPTNVDRHPESLFDLNLTKYDVAARIQGVGRVEDYQFLVGTTHFDDEDNLLYVTKEVYVGKSPVGPVILVKRAPIMKGGLVAKRIDDTPVYVEDVVRMTGAVIAEDAESLANESDAESSNPMSDEFGNQTTGGEATHQYNAVPRRRSRKARGHSGRKKGDGPVTVGGSTFEATRVSDNKPLSSEGGKQNRLATGDVDPLSPSLHRPGKVTAPGEWKSRLRDSTRIDYAKSRSINKDAGAGGAGAAIHTAAQVECDVEGNPLHIFKSVTDYIECHYTGELNIEALMGDQ